MHLLFYTFSLSNFFLNKFLILSHTLLYFSNISSSLTEKFMYLIFSSKYLTYAFIYENSMHNGDGRAVPSYIYLIKCLYEPLFPYQSFFGNIYFISTNRSFVYMKFIFDKTFFTKNQVLFFHFYTM